MSAEAREPLVDAPKGFDYTAADREGWQLGAGSRTRAPSASSAPSGSSSA